MFVGCSTSPEPRFYTLSAGGNPAQDRNEKALMEYSIAVGPVTLPEMVDRPELVVRVGVNQVALLEQHRWAEPLRSEIPRVLAENLAQLLGASQVVTYPQNASGEAEYRVLVDIQRFESVLGQTVTIDALWAVRRTSGKDSKTGRSVVRESTGGAGHDALVAAHGRALAAVSREIAEAIRSTERTAR
jgi:uncharacterized lipoprotein YmbA